MRRTKQRVPRAAFSPTDAAFLLSSLSSLFPISPSLLTLAAALQLSTTHAPPPPLSPFIPPPSPPSSRFHELLLRQPSSLRWVFALLPHAGIYTWANFPSAREHISRSASRPPAHAAELFASEERSRSVRSRRISGVRENLGEAEIRGGGWVPRCTQARDPLAPAGCSAERDERKPRPSSPMAPSSKFYFRFYFRARR